MHFLQDIVRSIHTLVDGVGVVDVGRQVNKPQAVAMAKQAPEQV